jgi:hypothetical protein
MFISRNVAQFEDNAEVQPLFLHAFQGKPLCASDQTGSRRQIEVTFDMNHDATDIGG